MDIELCIYSMHEFKSVWLYPAHCIVGMKFATWKSSKADNGKTDSPTLLVPYTKKTKMPLSLGNFSLG